MNYANMIEEKHLKKGFIIATLISTVIGTFTTGINLYERVRDRHNQHKTDHNQDEKIKELERRADASDKARRQAEKEKHEHAMAQLGHNSNNNNNNGNNGNYSNGGNNWSQGGYPYPQYQYPPLPYNRPQNDLRDALAASGPMIRREYDRDYARMGSRFAKGDTIAQNELQAQIIDLQASVIRLLQEALDTGTMPDPAALYAAAGRARNGSIHALQDQYQRMLTAAPLRSEIGGSYGGERSRRGLRSSSVASGSTRDGGDDNYDYARRRSGHDWGAAINRDLDRARDRRSQSQSGSGVRSGSRRSATFPMEPPPIFCRYALELQQDWRRPLDVGDGNGSRDRGRDRDRDDDDCDNLTCPACMGQFAIEHDRSWKMHKPVIVGERVEEIVNRDSRPGSDGDGDDGRGAGGSDAGDDDGAEQGNLVTTRRRNVIELVQDRQFVVSNRFIVKCHRPAIYDIGPRGGGGGYLLPPTYACCLCDRFDSMGSGKVTVCNSMSRLVNHVCEKHTVGELLSDPDIREIRPPPRR
ncbi:hypothetical protein SBRCBS47491_003844 [Sporothrix bragantina]|uniref:Uncharacterized protein n=1 Tax=Sporothrix bragantina TaxID=671064 RepID=A0ABP0BK33_9PEZI